MISIIIPTLNEESVLEKTLQNLKKISAFSYEIIISDGRSTDRTLEIARKYADKILVYDGLKRQTIAQARNMGASEATQEFLVFIDADVVIPDPEEFFKKALEFFRDDEKLSALTVSQKIFRDCRQLN